VFEPAPKNRQKEAVAFLQNQLFREPVWLFPAEMRSRVKSDFGVETIAGWHRNIISSLYASDRLQRLIDSEAAKGQAAYGLIEFFLDMEAGIWSELSSRETTTVYRRNLQKIHLEKLIELTKSGAQSPGTISTYLRTT